MNSNVNGTATENNDQSNNQEGVQLDTQDKTGIEDQKSTTQTRSKYDGSKPHGVKPSAIEKVLDYDRDLERLKLRFNTLNSEYETLQEKYRDTPDISKRAALLKAKSSKERQIRDLLKVKKELIDLRPKIEEKELAAQAATKFDDFSF